MSPTHDAYKKKVRYIVSYKTYIQAEILLKEITHTQDLFYEISQPVYDPFKKIVFQKLISGLT